MTAVARSNYQLYTTTGVTLDTTQFGQIKGWKPYRGELARWVPTMNTEADRRVVSSQAEALVDGTRYAYGFITTKCLPDVLPTPTLVKDALASGRVEAWTLIQVRLRFNSPPSGSTIP